MEFQTSLKLEEIKQVTGRESIDRTFEISPRASLNFRSESAESILPFHKEDIPFTVTSIKVIEAFSKCAAKLNYREQEKTNSGVSVCLKKRNLVKRLILCCTDDDPREETVVSLQISLNEAKCKRSLFIKGVSGNPHSICKLIDKFKPELTEIQQSTNSYQIIEEEEPVMTCKIETTCYYEISRILSDQGYSLGKSVNDFLNSFPHQYRNPKESAELLPQPLESIKSLIENTVLSLFSDYNLGKGSNEKIMQFCRPAVEKYVFGKVFGNLIAIYKASTEELDSFVVMCRAKHFKDSEYMDAFCVAEDFRLNGSRSPYSEAIESINKLENFACPLEQISCVSEMSNAIKTACVEHWKGEKEIPNLEQEINVMKFVLVKSKLESPAAYTKLMLDYSGATYDWRVKVIKMMYEAIHSIHDLYTP